MSLCILAAGKTVVLAASAFTLSWTHSVERTEWREDWLVEPAGLRLVEARVRGSGAGMEPAEDAVLDGGWWTYRPTLRPIPALVLAASGVTGQGWSLCAAGECREIGAAAGAPVRIAACTSETSVE